MAIIRNKNPCPFCGKVIFTLNTFINDEYEPGYDPVDSKRKVISISCSNCGRIVLTIEQSFDETTSMIGVTFCPKCHLAAEGNESIRPNRSPIIEIHSPGDSICPSCGSTLEELGWI